MTFIVDVWQAAKKVFVTHWAFNVIENPAGYYHTIHSNKYLWVDDPRNKAMEKHGSTVQK